MELSGQGPALLFAHGLFGTHADGRWLTGVASDFTIICPDLRGRGRSSPARSPEEHSFDEHAADLSAILGTLGFTDAVVVGASFGAAVALAFARTYPDQVRALILMASAFGGKNEPMGEGNLGIYRDLADRIANEGLVVVAGEESERTASRRPIERWTVHDEASLVAWLQAVPMYRPFKSAADLRELEVPVLLIPGQDEIHTRQLSRSLERSLPGARMADSGSAFAETVGNFLENLE